MSLPPLKTSSYLVLGLVRGGFSSGYAIRAAIEGMRLNVFWGTSFAQIYPELAKLEADGFLVRHDDPQGARARSAYALTESGDQAFLAWLTRPELPAMDARDEGIMRLGFGDHLSREEGIALLGRLRERAQHAEREFREEMMPLAEGAGQQGWRYPLLVARLGAEYNAWAAGFFAQLERELDEAET